MSLRSSIGHSTVAAETLDSALFRAQWVVLYCPGPLHKNLPESRS
jgi:hypothetical protein